MRILYHQDFDGMASAALLASALQDEAGLRNFSFAPVDHHMAPAWLQPRPPGAGTEGPFAVVDFLYHPNATAWYDHHATTFLTPDVEAHYRRFREPLPAYAPWVLDTRAPSCAALIHGRFTAAGWDGSRYQHLVACATQIDQAAYESPEHYFRAEEPHVRLDQGRRFLNAGQLDQVIRQLMVPDLEAALALAASEADRAVQGNLTTLEAYRPHQARLRDIVVTDVVREGLPYLRFAAYHTFPHATYGITLYQGSGGRVLVGLNKNPWLDVHHHHLGQLARAAGPGNGGHSYAAGAEFAPQQYAEPYVAAVQWVQQVIRVLEQRP